MSSIFNGKTPIYLQIMNEIKKQIVTGKRKPGERIDSVRDLAAEFSVNPNTVQRALSELEREGILYAERTNGRFVTSQQELIQTGRINMAKEKVIEFVKQMESLGYSKQEMIGLLQGGKDNE